MLFGLDFYRQKPDIKQYLYQTLSMEASLFVYLSVVWQMSKKRFQALEALQKNNRSIKNPLSGVMWYSEEHAK
jgi:DNA-binding transcriptional regulator/RsmH inhibitor MraZ